MTKKYSRGYVLIIVIVLGLTLSTLFLLRLKILGGYVQQVDTQILETQATYLAQSALRYAKAFPQNTAVYYVDKIPLGVNTLGSIEAQPSDSGWDLYGRVETPIAKVALHWFWDGSVLTDKTRKKLSSSNY
jgi:hypothetical protein